MGGYSIFILLNIIMFHDTTVYIATIIPIKISYQYFKFTSRQFHKNSVMKGYLTVTLYNRKKEILLVHGFHIPTVGNSLIVHQKIFCHFFHLYCNLSILRKEKLNM